MEASEDLITSTWSQVSDTKEKMRVFFPHKPVQMQFDLPHKEAQKAGHLNIYTSPFNNGVLTLNTISSPLIQNQEIDPLFFENFFYTTFIQRIFHQPKTFKQHQSYQHETVEFEGYPALKFTFSFKDNQALKKMSGLAVLKNDKIYTLFYLANQNDFKDELLQRFIHSFEFMD